MSADKFTDQIKKAIEAGVDPPTEMWDRISNQLDIEDVWGRVENQLDIDEVWSNVARNMDTAEKFEFYEKMAYVPLLLFLMFFGYQPKLYNNQDALRWSQITKNDIEQLAAVEEDRLEMPASQNIDNSTNSSEEKIYRTSTMDESQDVILSAANERILYYLSSMDNLGAEPLEGISFKKEYLDMAVQPLNSMEEEDEERIVIEPERRGRRFFIGPGVALKNSWLINYKTIQGYENLDLVNASAVMAGDMSIQAGLELAPRWMLQADAMLYSGVGQGYGEYVLGQYVNREIKLSYTGLQLAAKFNQSAVSYASYTMNKNWMLGAYAFGLTNAKEKQFWHIDELEHQIEVKDFYRPVDLGLVIGYEFELFTKAGISLSSGVQFRYGMNNVFGGDEVIPGQFKRTNTASVGLNTALRFYGKTKK